MTTALSTEDSELHKAFETLLTLKELPPHVLEICKLIHSHKLDRESLNQVLTDHSFEKVEDIKSDLLDLLILYINLVLNDDIISTNEKHNVEILKKYFKIKEGDFYRFRLPEIEDIINRQFERIYEDQDVSKEEAIHSVELQSLFNLSYDQFTQLKENEIRRALNHGAQLSNLDSLPLSPSVISPESVSNREIPQQIKGLVWNRDNGKCRRCDSSSNLEFTHIIPVSKGGSNTYRNIQLICKNCTEFLELNT